MWVPSSLKLIKNKALIRLALLLLLTTLSPVFCLQAQEVSPIEKMAATGYNLRFKSADSGIILVKKALNQARQMKSKEDEAICYAYLALTYRRMLDLKNFTSNANAAYEIAKSAKSERADAHAAMAVGLLKSFIEDSPGAIKYQLKAYTVFSKLKEYSQCAKISADISYLFSPAAPAKVQKYAQEAMDYATKSGDAESILHARLAMGSYFMDKMLQGNTKTLQTVIAFFKETIRLAEENETQIVSKSNIGVAYLNLAALYMDGPKPIPEKEILTNLEKAIQIGRRYQLKNIYRNSTGLKGQYFMAKGDYETAKQLFEAGIAYQQMLPYQDNNLMASFYDNLKALSAKRQDFKSYYQYDTLFTTYNKLRNAESTQKMLQNADARFESDKKIVRIQQLEKDNQLQHDNKLLGFGLSAILLIGLVFMYRSYYFRQRYYQNREDILLKEQANSDLQLKLMEKETLENLSEKLSLQRRLLASQMDPHFIFNALGNIQSMILKKDTAPAISFLGKFAKLTRQILEQSRMEMISLEEEILTLKRYITLQQLRLNNGFNYEIVCEADVDPQICIPPLLIQPFVENAIEHGLKPLIHTGEGILNIHFSLESKAKYLICTITDNGIGLAASKNRKRESSHQSMSTKITGERLEQMQKANVNAGFEITERQDATGEKGCMAILRIPID